MTDDADTPGLRMPAVRPGEFVCVACGQSAEPAARVGVLAICARCGASNVLDGDGRVRRATAQDTDVLMPGDRAMLVKARSAIVRPKV